MSRIKKIAIVGRPNVGKSALFNAICKKRISIVDEQEGITRDRLYQRTEFFSYPFEIIDTGGIEVHSKADFSQEIKRQAEIAIEEADSIIMVVDARVGPQDLDKEVATILHRKDKPVCLAVNKIDNRSEMSLIHQFAGLGIPHMVAVSAAQGFQIAELLDIALSSFDKSIIPEDATTGTKIAILGRPNVGKSLLLNTLLGEDRSIVSPIAGTTRDAIDTTVTFGGKEYILIDTAGIRRKHKEKEVVEKFAAIRSASALERADIALLVMDASSGMTTEEKKIARMIEQESKGCILLFNKWDLTKGFRMEHCLKGIEQEVPFLKHCPKLFISAKTNRNVDKIFPTVAQVEEASNHRISTGTLNKCLIAAMQKCHPTMLKGKRLRIYYLAQVDIKPPRFVLFVNNPNLMEEAYKKYLINQLRDSFNFSGVPLILELRGKEQHKNRRPPQRPKGAPFDRDIPHFKHEEINEEEYDDGDHQEDDESFIEV
ncbi:MAG: GTPase Der [Chlamydiia bacterium]|nr:GTPase Der [Chlamydiia bacterium]